MGLQQYQEEFQIEVQTAFCDSSRHIDVEEPATTNLEGIPWVYCNPSIGEIIGSTVQPLAPRRLMHTKM